MDLEDRIKALPDSPGVYLMKDEAGEILYVGKAASLKKRVTGYFRSTANLDIKTRVQVGRIASFDTLLTATETEALLLESALIKRHQPRYNVILKDGKRYPSLRIDTRAEYPRLEVVRKVKKDGAVYFGPFVSGTALGRTVRLINRTFPLRKCKGPAPPKRVRPCLNAQMGRCLGPCVNDVNPKTYADIVGQVVMFLKGRTPELAARVRREMEAAAASQEFERAAVLRDRMFAVEKVLERQVAVTSDFLDRDVAATATAPGGFAITLAFVRGGSLLGTRHFFFEGDMGAEAEAVSALVRQYYEKDRFVPPQILTSAPIDDAGVLEAWLGEKRGGRVRILCPARGEKKKLIEITRANAADALARRLSGDLERQRLLERLQKRLRARALPNRIECVDISHTRGAQTVASRVVFLEGRPSTGDWRRYKIKSAALSDDYGAIQEVLSRRFDPANAPDPFPDLLMIDGGKGQVSAAMAVLEVLGLVGRFTVAGIAKGDGGAGEGADRIFLPGQTNPVAFGKDADLLLFLQSIRDEAHRFAIALHRKRRGQSVTRSAIDDVPGVGPKRKQALLRHFQSVKRLSEASVDDMASVEGMTRAAAQNVFDALRKKSH